MAQILELVPIILFFIAYQYDGSTIHMGTWSYHFDGIFSATTILMAATAVQVAISAALRGRIERREIWILLAVGVFGGITLWFRDPSFIQWKPTIFNWTLALVFLAAHFFSEKNLIERTLGSQLDLPPDAWRKLNFLWIGNFLVVGTLNILVALNFSESSWVSYKLYSAIGFTILLATLTIVIVSPHLPKENRDNTTSDE